MKKILFLMALSLTGFTAQAETRCYETVKQAVEAQAQLDFPNEDLYASIPDMQNAEQLAVNSYDIEVFSTYHGENIAGYNIVVDEVCGVISGPSRNY